MPHAAHFILFVRDQANSTAFYTHTLDQPPRLDVPGMTEFDLGGGAVLGLMPRAGAARLLGDSLPELRRPAHSPSSELYLLVEAPEAAIDRALAAGATLLSPMGLRDWGHEAAYLRDPDGHVLALARPG